MTRRLLRSIRAQPIALLALFVALGGSSFAAVNSRASKSDVVHMCVASGGKLRVVENPKRCKSREQVLSLNREGARGPVGPRGADGGAGPKGDAGGAGAAGPKGDAGAAGAKGDAGTAGPAGAKGSTGDAGPAGAKGDAGDAGAAGPKGDTGDAGPKGDTGDAGPKGDTGETGPRGADGQSVTGTGESAGANCSNGGVRYTSAGGTHYVCNGETDTPTLILDKLKTVDGSGSGLDADTLAGVGAASYLLTSQFTTYLGSAFPSYLNVHFPTAFDNRILTLFGTGTQAATVNGSGSAVECTMAEIGLTAAQYPPGGRMFAAGQVLAINQNPALFALLGTTYGGDGVTTFKVPDLRKQAPGGTAYTICFAGVWPTQG